MWVSIYRSPFTIYPVEVDHSSRANSQVGKGGLEGLVNGEW